MHKLYPLLLALLLATTAYAQSHFTSLDCDRNTKLISSTSATDGTICFLGYNDISKELHVWVVDKKGNAVSSTSHKYYQIAEPNIIGSTLAEDSFTFYTLETNTIHNGEYLSKGEQVVREFYFNRKTKDLAQSKTAVLTKEKNNKPVANFSHEGVNYILFYNKRVDSLQVNSFKQLSGIGRKTLHVPQPYFDEKFGNDSFYFASGHENPLPAQAHIRRKAYVRDGNLYFTFEAPEATTHLTTSASTHIVKLDLDKSEVEITKLPELQYGQNQKFNSYLFKETIFRLTLSKDQLSLTAFDLHSNKQIASYNYTPKEEIAIRANPGFWGTIYSRSRFPQDTKTVLKLMANGVPAIAAYESSYNSVELTVGSYLKPSGGGYMMGAAAAGSPTMYIPVGAVGSAGTSYEFKSSFDYPSLSIASHPVSKTPFDRIDDYIFQQTQKRNAVVAEYMMEKDGKVYLAVRDKKNQKVDFLEFASTL